MNILVTGGAGFIGSHFVRAVLHAWPHATVLTLDKLTYAGNMANLGDVIGHPRHRFVRGDIANQEVVDAVCADGVDAIVNFAAESHVDRSILDAAPFVRTNVTGTHVLLEAARRSRVMRFIQISTDEVYGPAPPDRAFGEDAPLNPSSPYAASKAAGDLLCLAYRKTYGLPVTVLRCTNNYGPYQFPEKFIPLTITNALEGRPVPIYGDGMQERDWLFVEDHCRAVLAVLESADPDPILNIASGRTIPNLHLARMVLELLGVPPSALQAVPDRPGHDRRYALDTSRLTTKFGWSPQIPLEEGLLRTVQWYRAHQAWWTSVKNGEYLTYHQAWYEGMLHAGRARAEGETERGRPGRS